MKKIGVVLTLAVAFCFAIMAVNPNPVLADDAVEENILKKVKKIKHILNDEVLPKLDQCCECPVGVPKTWQTTSYETGDDGDLQMGIPWPDPRFTANGDGTVTDNLTGLIWLKNALCDGSTKTWADALTYCNVLADPNCGLTDGSIAGEWRLPNVKELLSLIDYGQINPALPSGHPFDNVQMGHYWSSTSIADGTTFAWDVYFYGGHVQNGDKSSSRCVWCVRGGN